MFTWRWRSSRAIPAHINRSMTRDYTNCIYTQPIVLGGTTPTRHGRAWHERWRFNLDASLMASSVQARAAIFDTVDVVEHWLIYHELACRPHGLVVPSTTQSKLFTSTISSCCTNGPVAPLGLKFNNTVIELDRVTVRVSCVRNVNSPNHPLCNTARADRRSKPQAVKNKRRKNTNVIL